MNYNKDRKFEGIWIPKEVWFDAQLSLMQKCFLIEINSLDNDKKRGCYASNKYFAEFFTLSNTRCSQIISSLKELKVIEIKYHFEGKEIKERNIFMTDLGIKYFKGGIKKSLKRDNYINILSKDNKDDSGESSKNDFLNLSNNKNNHLFNYWNNIPTTRTHKNNTKRHKNILKLIRQLKAGMFYKYNAVDKQFLKDNKVDNFYLKKKFTDDEIKEIFIHLSNMLLDGYTPDMDKSKFSKDLDTLIFNSRTNKSMFFKCYVNPPKLLVDEIKSKPKNQECYNLYREFFKDKITRKRDENKLILKFNDIWDEFCSVHDNVGQYYSHTSFSSYFGSIRRPETFFENHIRWLIKQKRSSVFNLDPESYSWINFISYMENQHGYEINPDDGKLEKIKLDYQQAMRRMN